MIIRMGPDAISISVQIRARRLALGLSLAQLAARVNTSPATLCRYEKGWRRFEVYTLRKLAAALGCRLDIRLAPLEAPARRPPTRGAAVRRLRRLFWDRPLRGKDFEDYPGWVVKRVLEYGTLPDVHCLLEALGRGPFLREVARTRFESAKTANFWKRMLELEGVPCMKKRSRKGARSC